MKKEGHANNIRCVYYILNKNVLLEHQSVIKKINDLSYFVDIE